LFLAEPAAFHLSVSFLVTDSTSKLLGGREAGQFGVSKFARATMSDESAFHTVSLFGEIVKEQGY
jgi:hypothetical protein